MRRLPYTIRTGGACLSSSSGTAPTQDRILEFPGQRGRHTFVFVSSQWFRRRIHQRRKSAQEPFRKGSSADR